MDAAAHIDLKKAQEHCEGLLREEDGAYLWIPRRKDGGEFDVQIKIKIRKTKMGFQPIRSHEIKTPQQATPYASINIQPTAQRALEQCIAGFRMYLATTPSDQVQWVPYGDWTRVSFEDERE